MISSACQYEGLRNVETYLFYVLAALTLILISFPIFANRYEIKQSLRYIAQDNAAGISFSWLIIASGCISLSFIVSYFLSYFMFGAFVVFCGVFPYSLYLVLAAAIIIIYLLTKAVVGHRAPR